MLLTPCQMLPSLVTQGGLISNTSTMSAPRYADCPRSFLDSPRELMTRSNSIVRIGPTLETGHRALWLILQWTPQVQTGQ